MQWLSEVLPKAAWEAQSRPPRGVGSDLGAHPHAEGFARMAGSFLIESEFFFIIFAAAFSAAFAVRLVFATTLPGLVRQGWHRQEVRFPCSCCSS